MGTRLKDLVIAKPINTESLNGKILMVDAFNVLYQFLTSIRQRDGTLLKTSNGVVTSHVMGLFNRTAKLMQLGLKLAFVFDGKSPELKFRERERRSELKQKASENYKLAKQEGDIGAMKMYAARSSRLSHDMVNDAKVLLEALGVPVVQAPSEGEAQAAYMVANGQGYGVASEDYDALLFGVPRLIKGLSVSQKRKQKGILNYKRSDIELIELADVLNTLKISKDQLIVLGILVGTDFNPGGVKGIGPKKALELVHFYGTNFDGLFSDVNWEFEHSWTDVFNIFKNIKHTDIGLEWKSPDLKRLKELLVGRFEFSEAFVMKKIESLGKGRQQSLGAFL